MAIRDALLHNRTGSNFEALQSGDTARIRGDFLLKDVSENDVLSIDVSAGTVNITGNITSSMNISGSVTSTGSFGKLVGDDYFGDGAAIRDTLPRSSGLITSSAQLAPAISGAFNAGFFFGFERSASISGGIGITGSFGRVEGIEFHGTATGLASTLPRNPGIVTGSKQLASQISGSFNKGFEFTGTIASAGGGPGAWSIGASIGFNLCLDCDTGSKMSSSETFSVRYTCDGTLNWIELALYDGSLLDSYGGCLLYTSDAADE